MKKYCFISCVSFFTALMALFCCVWQSLAETNEYAAKISELDRRGRHMGGQSIQNIENDYLDLLKGAKTDEQRGETYASLAILFQKNEATNAIKILNYSLKSLTFPLVPKTRCQMLQFLADEYRSSFENTRNDNMRIKAAEHYIKGLSVILSVTTEENLIQDLPPVGKGVFDGPISKKYEERHAKQVAAREAAEAINKLIDYRRQLIESCASLYREHPDKLPELQSLAEKCLSNNTSVIDELLTRAGRK